MNILFTQLKINTISKIIKYILFKLFWRNINVDRSTLYPPYPIIKPFWEHLAELCPWNTSFSLGPYTAPEISVMGLLHLVNKVFELWILLVLMIKWSKECYTSWLEPLVKQISNLQNTDSGDLPLFTLNSIL